MRMFWVRFSCSILCGAVLLAGCSQTPTSPSAPAPNAAIGEVPQTGVPVPPRNSFTVPNAIGLTRFVAFGDSITWGATSAWDLRFMFASASGGYPERLLSGLETYHAPQQFTMFNEGQPGEKAVNALARFQAMLTNRRPQAVLLLEGINDISSGVSPTQVASSLRQMVDASINIGVPVLLATMFQTYEVVDPDGNLRRNGASGVPSLNTEIKKIPSGRLNVHIVDLYPIMNNRDYVGADGIHTTDAGFTVMASAFLDVIEAAFPVRSGGPQ